MKATNIAETTQKVSPEVRKRLVSQIKPRFGYVLDHFLGMPQGYINAAAECVAEIRELLFFRPRETARILNSNTNYGAMYGVAQIILEDAGILNTGSYKIIDQNN